MRKFVIFAVLATALISSCIGQAEEKKQWTVEDWKTHLIFVNPDLSQDMTNNMGAGLINVEELPVGTHMTFKAEGKVSAEGIEMPLDMTLSVTVSGTETIKGKDCSVVEITIEMEMEAEGESSTITLKGKEWLDKIGTPQKMEGEVIIEILGMEMPMIFSSELVGEETYEGRDCWVFQGTYEEEIMGISIGEIKRTTYVDKETYAAVRTITENEETEIDSGYQEAASYMSESEWVLGGRETITTDLGTYDCQVIYLQENGKTVGTIWATEDIRAPLKYEVFIEEEDMGMIMTIEIVMILVEYTWGT